MTKITNSYLDSIDAEDFAIIENEIIVFYMNGADLNEAVSMSFQDSDDFPATVENMETVFRYFVKKFKPHLTCNVCGYKQYDEETVVQFLIAEREKEPQAIYYPQDIYYRCGACLNVDEEKKVVGRNYNNEDENDTVEDESLYR